MTHLKSLTLISNLGFFAVDKPYACNVANGLVVGVQRQTEPLKGELSVNQLVRRSNQTTTKIVVELVVRSRNDEINDAETGFQTRERQGRKV